LIAYLIAHKPSYTAAFAVFIVTDQIRERNSHFAERFISENAQFVAQIEKKIEVIEVFAAKRIEIESHVLIPLRILVSLCICFRFLRLLMKMMVLVAGIVAGEGHNCMN
jgi:hypothetical protein